MDIREIKFNQSLKIFSFLLPWLGVFFLLTPFMYAYLFCVPQRDDFDEATKAMFLFDLPGALYEVGRNWLTWSGRFTYHFVAVFFGVAIRNSVLFSLACIAPMGLFFWGCRKLSSLISKFPPSLFAALCCIALYSNFTALNYFYNYMDSFSTILQWSCYFIFFVCCLTLYLNITNKAAWKNCLISGVLAIGVYEISALAVFWTTLAFLYTDAKRKTQAKKLTKLKAIFKSWYISPFFRLQCWFYIALAFSFFAPGNFNRTSARPVLFEQKIEQILHIPEFWLAAIIKFFSSSWPVLIICLAIFLAFFSDTNFKSVPKKIIRLCFFIILFCSLFACSVIGLLALTDAPMGSNPKFGDMICLPLALGFGLFIYLLMLTPIKKIRETHLAVVFLTTIGIIYFCCVIYSQNFQKIAINAANGEFLRYSQFYKERENQLAIYSGANPKGVAWPAFGLMGEWQNPEARKLRKMAELNHAILDNWPDQVFPLQTGAIFRGNPTQWPNYWASWFYNVGSISARNPAPIAILNKIKNKEYTQLNVPDEFHLIGIKEVGLALAPGNQENSFLWLIIKSTKPILKKIWIVLPGKISWKRLLPLPIQVDLYNRLKEKHVIDDNLSLRLTGSILCFPPRKPFENWYVFPLPGYASIPDFIYFSLNGKIFQKNP